MLYASGGHPMDLEKIIAELRAERNRLEEAILAIERISEAPGKKRRGRPAKRLTEGQGDETAEEDDPKAGDGH